MRHFRWLSTFQIFVVTAICGLPVGCGPVSQREADYEQIISTFADFRDAVELQQGDNAVAQVSQSSVDRFEEFREWALFASEDELKQKSIVEQIEVLRLRHLMSQDELQSATGRDVIARLVELGELPTPFIEGALLSQPVFQEGRCFLTVYDDSGPAKEKITFVSDEDGWKVDIASMEYVLEKVYTGIVRKHVKSHGDKPVTQSVADELVIQQVTSDWSKNLDLAKLWQPLAVSDETPHDSDPKENSEQSS